MGSLQRRLQIGLAASLLLFTGAISWLAHDTLHRTADAFVRSRLDHDAEALLAAIHWGPENRLVVGEGRLTPVYRQPFSGHYFVIRTADGQRLRSRSLWDDDLADRPLEPGTTAGWRTAGPLDQRLLVRGFGFRLDDRALTLTIAEDVTPLDQRLVGFERLILLAALLALALMLLIQRWVVQRTLAMLKPVYRDIARLEAGGSGSLTEQAPAEILPLVRAFNRLLALFNQRLTRSRQFAGNLGHALKAPLTRLRQQLEDPAEPIAAPTRGRLLEQLDRLCAVIERQLQRARMAGAGGPGLRFDPAAELPVLLRLLRQIHAARDLELTCDIHPGGDGATDPALTIDADREDLLELLGNLLDNACKWARTRVHCTVTTSAAGLCLRVEDDGPGCSPAAIADITERGMRLDEAVAGHGLGLAIVSEIVDGYQGAITFVPSPRLGGLAVEVRLPRALPDRLP